MIFDKDILTREQKEWFSDRMDENGNGTVKVPNYLYDKFRRLTHKHYENHEIKTWLIENCY